METYRIFYKESGKIHDYGIFKGTFKEVEKKIERLNARFGGKKKFFWTAC